MFKLKKRFDLKTRVGDYVISTVDLMGINHQFDDNLPPLFYETMIFAKGQDYDEETNPFVGYQVRYTTKEEARKGHKEAIKFVKKFLKEE